MDNHRPPAHSRTQEPGWVRDVVVEVVVGHGRQALDDVAAELATSRVQVYAMVRRKQLRAIRVGGRGQWRISRQDLEAWIEQNYADTGRYIDEHPFDPDADPPG